MREQQPLRGRAPHPAIVPLQPSPDSVSSACFERDDVGL